MSLGHADFRRAERQAMSARRRLLPSAAGWFTALVMLSGFTSSAEAGGFANENQAASADSRASAVTASVGDASAAFYNPAAMVRLDRSQVYLGGAAITLGVSFEGEAPFPGASVAEETNFKIYPMPNLYGVVRLGERWAVGTAVNTPYGLGSEWKDPNSYSGRFIAYSSALVPVSAGLSVAYAIDDRWSVAVGGNVLFTNLQLKRRIPGAAFGCTASDVADAAISATMEPGYGWQAALAYAPSQLWRIGAVFQSGITSTVEGNADFTQIVTGDATCDAIVAANLPPDQPVHTEFNYPNLYTVGVAWLPHGDWTIEGDFQFGEYSVWQSTDLHFQATPMLDESIPQDYQDAWQLRLGAERRLSRVALRAGYHYSTAASPSKSLSPIYADLVRHGFAVGAGYALGSSRRVRLDLAYLVLLNVEASTNGASTYGYNGSYDATLHELAIGVMWVL